MLKKGVAMAVLVVLGFGLIKPPGLVGDGSAAHPAAQADEQRPL